jgi:hypothetical protein
MVTSELTGEVSIGVLLVFLVFWRWGRTNKEIAGSYMYRSWQL